ncbi:DUF1292 domain-containing protein [Anaplasma phagocytophilum]|uniref:DUF1292 domain-containing protein n=1 Tax=Anaplasma phagocytophilum TaxID=948 RepID=UPI002010BB23|nr:DUF1292 domain-containing protein [Anaplasma phagocytophilum]UQD54577.1 hypothetical protein ESP60_04670 [Anaplasma phagocytophilum]
MNLPDIVPDLHSYVVHILEAVEDGGPEEFCDAILESIDNDENLEGVRAAFMYLMDGAEDSLRKAQTRALSRPVTEHRWICINEALRAVCSCSSGVRLSSARQIYFLLHSAILHASFAYFDRGTAPQAMYNDSYDLQDSISYLTSALAIILRQANRDRPDVTRFWDEHAIPLLFSLSDSTTYDTFMKAHDRAAQIIMLTQHILQDTGIYSRARNLRNTFHNITMLDFRRSGMSAALDSDSDSDAEDTLLSIKNDMGFYERLNGLFESFPTRNTSNPNLCFNIRHAVVLAYSFINNSWIRKAIQEVQGDEWENTPVSSEISELIGTLRQDAFAQEPNR